MWSVGAFARESPSLPWTLAPFFLSRDRFFFSIALRFLSPPSFLEGRDKESHRIAESQVGQNLKDHLVQLSR